VALSVTEVLVAVLSKTASTLVAGTALVSQLPAVFQSVLTSPCQIAWAEMGDVNAAVTTQSATAEAAGLSGKNREGTRGFMGYECWD
jgi:hypothetical protein